MAAWAKNCTEILSRYRRPGEGEGYNVQRAEADMDASSALFYRCSSFLLSPQQLWSSSTEDSFQVYTFKYVPWACIAASDASHALAAR